LNTNNLTLINQERNGKIEHILNYNANDVWKVIRWKKGNYIILKNSKWFTIVNDLNKETICEDLVFRWNPDLFMDIKLVTIKWHECIIFTNWDRKLLINPLNNNHIDLFEDQYFITLNTIFINDEYKHTINTNEWLITIVKLRTFHQYTAVINNDWVLSIYDNTTKEHLRTIEWNIEDFEYLKDTDIKCIINKQLEYTKDGERNYTV